MFEVKLTATDVDRFEGLLGRARVDAVRQLALTVASLLDGRTVWNINSTASGGGVAEMLRSLLRYSRGLGVDTRWLVIEGPPDFFRITKRLHNALHDTVGDGSPLGADEAALFEQVAAENMAALRRTMQPGDVIICHDPQTAGLIPPLVADGVLVVWRCHIGHEDHHGREIERGWAFLRKYLAPVPYAVFSRGAYAPSWIPHKRAVVVPPNIDPFSAKNQFLDDDTIRAILLRTGLVSGEPSPKPPLFVREDGSGGCVERAAQVVRLGAPPPWDRPLVVQVSRWDTMKDPVGVLEGFVELLRRGAPNAELVLAGPSVRSVADDPEGPEVFARVERAWRALPESERKAIHLVQLPMEDADENGAIVNALQRHAAVIVQKSLREGFGLTVTEAMWKRRPVVASAVGGIQDQIRDDVSGLLLRDPTDRGEFASALERILGDTALADRLGDAAYERVRDNYLSLASLELWAALLRLLYVR